LGQDETLYLDRKAHRGLLKPPNSYSDYAENDYMLIHDADDGYDHLDGEHN
jgi:hypothetical protein